MGMGDAAEVDDNQKNKKPAAKGGSLLGKFGDLKSMMPKRAAKK
jgi:hypothetical protein